MEIKEGKIFADDSYYTLKEILNEPYNDIRCERMQNQFGLSADEASSIDLGNMRFIFHDDEDSIDFSDDHLIGALPEWGSAYHVESFGKILKDKLPNEEVKVD